MYAYDTSQICMTPHTMNLVHEHSQDTLETPQYLRTSWYWNKEEIEQLSPSRKDGIDLKMETQHRKLYCSFIQDVGQKLKCPQLTIATAIIFCHRFYLRQSLAKNEWQTVATASLFLAGKVEETPRLLADVIVVSYEMMYRRDPGACRRIRQREIFEKQKKLTLIGERLLLSTLGFDLNIQHPYSSLVAALKKFKFIQTDVARIAWNFVNDWLRTTLCLQFKPHYIAAGAIFLAAKSQKVKLPSSRELVWWQEFDVSPRLLEDVIKQMNLLMEQKKSPVMPCAPKDYTEFQLVTRKPNSSNSNSSTTSSCVLSSDSSHISLTARDCAGSSVDCQCLPNEVEHMGVTEVDLNVTSKSENCYFEHTRVSHIGNEISRESTLPSDVLVSEAGQCQFPPGECASARSVVEDDSEPHDGQYQSEVEQKQTTGPSIISAGLSEFDKDRIKSKLKKRKREVIFLQKGTVTNESDYDAWIQKQLEDGIILDLDIVEKNMVLA